MPGALYVLQADVVARFSGQCNGADTGHGLVDNASVCSMNLASAKHVQMRITREIPERRLFFTSNILAKATQNLA
jgi:hypothetical protein